VPRYVGNYIWAAFQVVDSNGQPVTGATISYRVYYEELEEEGTMNHVGDGIYGAGFIPGNDGVWIIEAYNEVLHYRQSLSFLVEEGPKVEQWVDQSNIIDTRTPVQNIWYTLVDIDYGKPVQPIFCSIYQSNDGSATKEIEWEITDDISTFTGTINLASQDTAWFFKSGQQQYGVLNLSNGNFPFVHATWSDPGLPADYRPVMPIEFTRIRIRYRFTEAIGAGQYVAGAFIYRRKELIAQINLP
jgi:hypothetical protein